MDLIGDYGSDASDEEPQDGPSNGAVSTGNGVSAASAQAAGRPFTEQPARLPAPPPAAANDRWGSVFGAGILDRKRKPAASGGGGHSNGTAANFAMGAAANGDGRGEAPVAPKRKLASFMAPLKPLSAEELEVCAASGDLPSCCDSFLARVCTFVRTARQRSGEAASC